MQTKKTKMKIGHLSGKTTTLLHLINNLHPIDKIYLYAKDLSEPRYEFLINKREQAGIKNLNDPHAFIDPMIADIE